MTGRPRLDQDESAAAQIDHAIAMMDAFYPDATVEREGASAFVVLGKVRGQLETARATLRIERRELADHLATGRTILERSGEQDMLHAFTRMAKLGRNFGIGVSLISQRPQEVNKKVLNMTEVMFAFQMRGPQERKTIKDWSSDKDLEHDIIGDLPSLAVGDCFISSPQWLQIERKIHIAKKRTADVSSTPTVGTAAGPAKPLTPIDLEQLRGTMAATIEKAKAEDPKELNKRIRALERDLTEARRGNGRPDPAAVQQLVEAAVSRATHNLWRDLDRWRTALRVPMDRAQREVTGAAAALASLTEAFEQPLSSSPPEQGSPPPVGALRSTSTPPLVRQSGTQATRSAVTPARGRGDVAPAEGLSRPQQRMLNALATMYELTRGSMEHVPRNVIAALSQQSPRSSGWDKNLSTLRTRGLIAYPDADTMALTRDGEALATPDSTITSLADLHAAWRDLVSRPQWRMLDALISVCPDSMDRSALAAESGQSPASSGWDKNLSTLRSLGVIDYPSSSEAVATEFLFPRGLS